MESTSLDRLRAESLHAMITQSNGELSLDRRTMRRLRRQGFNRADIGRAIDCLHREGRVTASAGDDGIALRLSVSKAPGQSQRVVEQPDEAASTRPQIDDSWAGDDAQALLYRRRVAASSAPANKPDSQAAEGSE